jgi:hypothetical protein
MTTEARSSVLPPSATGATASPLAWIAEIFRRDRVLAWTGAWMLFQAAVAVALMPFDDRTILGLDPWVKPFKFCVSVAIFLWTLAWFLPSLRVARWVKRSLAVGFSLIMILEIACIMLQSARGVRSHFNFETGFDAAIFSTMGSMIALNTLLLVTVWLLFLVRGADLSPSYLWAVRLGLLVTLLGSAEGGLIVSHRQHAVGVADGGSGLPLVNWSTEGGDLRIAHMIGIHGMQVLPFFAFLLARFAPAWREERRVKAVFAFAAVYAIAGGAMLYLALQGTPLLPIA